MKPVLPYLRTFHTGYTYVAAYICRAMYDNTQIQLQLQEYSLPLTHACMQCTHYMWVLKEKFLLATDTVT